MWNGRKARVLFGSRTSYTAIENKENGMNEKQNGGTPNTVPENQVSPSTSREQVGKLTGQSAFTLYGCDLSTGEPHADAAGLPPCRHKH